LSRRQSDWRAEPLVTVCDGGDLDGGGRGGGAVMRVAAANRAAETAAGIAPGLPLADARARLLGLCTMPAEGQADREALAALADWCGRWTPWVALDATGPNATGDATGEPETLIGASHGLWLDVTGCAHLFGGETALVNDLLHRLAHFGFAARATLADTPGAAWAISRYGGGKHRAGAKQGNEVEPSVRKNGRVIAPGKNRAALAKLPLKGLRLGASETKGLERLGFRAIGDLYGIPRGALARRFGDGVMQRLDQALGRADEPLSPRRPVAAQRVRQDFAEPIASREAIAATVQRLLNELEGLLELAGKGARQLELSLYRGDGKVERLMVGTSAPVRAPAHLMRLFADSLDEVDAGFGFDSVTLAASQTQALALTQLALSAAAATETTPTPTTTTPESQNLFEQVGAEEDDGEVARLIDRLSGRLGLRNVRRLALFPSHEPELAVISPVAQSSTTAQAPTAAPPNPAPINTVRLQPSHWPAGRQRPLRLLPRPEAVEAIAMVPDDPPVMFRWRRILHRVVKADGPERIAAEWWHAEGAAPLGGAADSIRDYYRVEDERGRRFWLYRDALYRSGMTPGWWLHGLFG